MVKKTKKHILSITSFLFSCIAIFVSIRSCQISNESLELAKTEYTDKFKTIWEFEYNENQKIFKVSPSNEKVTIQGGMISYPDSISTKDWPIRLPKNSVYVSSPILYLKKELRKIITPPDSTVSVLDNGRIPVIVESYYTIDGKEFEDTSIYLLIFLAQINDDPYNDPKVQVLGMTYLSEFDSDVNKKEFLNNWWNEEIKILKSLD